MICPHCHMQFVGPDIPAEAPEGFICPVCGRNMSDRPIPPVSGLQVFGKYLAAILAGLPLGWLAGALVMMGLEQVFGPSTIPGVVQVGIVLLMMAAIGSFLSDRLEKIHSVAARWVLLLVVAVLPGGVLAAVLFLAL